MRNMRNPTPIIRDITPDEVAKIKKELKKSLPDIKFSFYVERRERLNVYIMESSTDFSEFEKYNPRRINQPKSNDGQEKQRAIFKKIYETIDSCAIPRPFFYYVEIGRWNKPYKMRKKLL